MNEAKVVTYVRSAAADKEAWQRAADAKGVSLNEWVNQVLNRRARLAVARR